MTETHSDVTRRRLPSILLSALVLALAGLAAYALWQDYAKSTAAATAARRAVFDNLHAGAVLQQDALTAPVRAAVTSLAQVPLVGRIDAGSVSRSFRPVLDAYPHVTALRIGFADGAVTDVSREAMPPMSGDPRPTPWYEAATATPGTTVETKPYRLSNGAPGISIARTIDGAEGAMAADLELKQFALPLEKLAAETKALAFVFSADGALLAHADIAKAIAGDGTTTELKLKSVDTLTDPVATAMVAAFRAGGPFAVRPMVAADRPYLAAVTQLAAPEDGRPDDARFLAIAMAEPALAGTFLAEARQEVLLALVILLLGLLALAARSVFRP